MRTRIAKTINVVATDKKNQHGGKREGAGRPPKYSMTTSIARAQAARDNSLLPLDYMLRIMRDDTADQRRRDEMAKAAAPYLHARYQAIAVTPINPEDQGGLTPVGFGAQVHVYLPDNGRRVAPPDAANDEEGISFGMPMLEALGGGSLSE